MMFDMPHEPEPNGNGRPDGDITRLYLKSAAGRDELPSEAEKSALCNVLQRNGLSGQPQESTLPDGKIIFTVNGSNAFLRSIFKGSGCEVSDFDPTVCTGIDPTTFKRLEGTLAIRLPEQHR